MSYYIKGAKIYVELHETTLQNIGMAGVISN